MEHNRMSVAQFAEARKPKRISTSKVLPWEWPFLTGEAISVEAVIGIGWAEYKITKIDTSTDNGLREAIQRLLAAPERMAYFANGFYINKLSAIITAAPDFRPDSPDAKEVLLAVLGRFHPDLFWLDGIIQHVEWPGFARCVSGRGINVTFFQSCTDPVQFLTTGRFSTAML